MANPVEVNVTLRGGLFQKDVARVVRHAIEDEVIAKVDERLQRQGKGMGAQRNVVTRKREEMSSEQARELRLVARSTRRWPRTKGTSWSRKNIGIIKAMAPRVARKTAQRIVEELM